MKEFGASHVCVFVTGDRLKLAGAAPSGRESSTLFERLVNGDEQADANNAF